MNTTLRVYRADWAPHIEAAVRAIATAAAFVYTAGYVTGAWLHRLNDRLSALLVRQPVPTPVDFSDDAWPDIDFDQVELKNGETFIVSRTIIQPCAAVPHRAAIAAPRVHPAVTFAASGLSQRAIAAKLGCTRYEVRKALKG
jgi:hypothetical protein